MKLKFPILAVVLVAAVPCHAAAPVYQEEGGLVVMEVENTSSSLGDWKKKTDVADFSGECHLEFTGNKPESGPVGSSLKYRFQIHKGGKYSLVIRAHKRLESERQDISNDCYVSLKGDFESGGTASKEILEADTKLFGGDKEGWGWTAQLDVGHKKFPAEYLLKDGEIYELTVSGRSKNFNIDRILLVHESENMGKVKRDNPAESKSDMAEKAAGGSRLPERTVRKLTNADGVSIEAELVSKTGDSVVIQSKGKRFAIKLSSLSKEDQEFIAGWEPK